MPKTFRCRPATRADAVACAKIIREWGAETQWMSPLDDLQPMADSWRDLLGSDTAWVAETEARVVGFCVREADNITGLYVASGSRNSGIGKALLDLAKSNRESITVWAYEKNERARKFYRREGFVEVGRELDEEDERSELIYIEHRWIRPQ